MAKFILSGGGDYTDSIKIDDVYKGMLDGKRILYIPWAMRSERYPSCLERIQNVFPAKEGYTIHLLSEEEFLQHREDYLNMYDGMYIGGGNTYRLLKLLRNTGFYEVIAGFIQHNKPIYGGSAGAIIMGKEIHTSADMNAVKLSFEEALGYDLCKGYSVVCHHTKNKNSEIRDYVLNYKIPVICLPEGTGIVCEDDIYTIEGAQTAHIIDNQGNTQKIDMGSHI